MGKSSKRKGAHYERKIVADHEDAGIVCRKVPLSGALEEYPGDLVIEDRLRGEVKARKGATGFKTILKWLEGNDLLFLQKIGEGGPGGGSPLPTVAMPWRRYITMLRAEDAVRRLAIELGELEAGLASPSEAAAAMRSIIARHGALARELGEVSE